MPTQRVRCPRGHSFTAYVSRYGRVECPDCKRAASSTQDSYSGWQPQSSSYSFSASDCDVSSSFGSSSSSSDSFSSGGGGDFGGGGASGDY